MLTQRLQTLFHQPHRRRVLIICCLLGVLGMSELRMGPHWLFALIILALLILLMLHLQRSWAIAVGAVTVLAIYTTQIETRWIAVTRLQMPVAHLPSSFEEFRIVQLTDFHYPMGLSDHDYRRIISKANALQPDLIVLTGDYVMRDVRDVPRFVRLAAKLHARQGVLAVFGNHDAPFRAELSRRMRQAGIKLLVNDTQQITRNGQSLRILGADELWYGKPDLTKMLRGVPDSAVKILLEHQPDFADTARRYPIDMQLSGHSHGGQVCLPFIGIIYVPGDSRHYPSGLYHLGRLRVYTNRGLGGISLFGFLPRFDCRPEIAQFTLVHENDRR